METQKIDRWIKDQRDSLQLKIRDIQEKVEQLRSGLGKKLKQSAKVEYL